MGSSWIRDGASVPCIARWTLNHWTTQEALEYIFNMEFTEASNESLVECEGYRGVNDAPKALFLRKELFLRQYFKTVHIFHEILPVVYQVLPESIHPLHSAFINNFKKGQF